ncbi:cation-binding protein [Intrasporangium oryzae NRRL B-24470]|uniref:Cation-binding protein n=1 Tax=Intrasporangium oryzae NRRL B-24470 TaxID=1386089 RepID=W9G7D8_9MICO|nr:DUF2249 domain-containing protein [Intrasporangium oryzae]EWT02071.1 cation-binding protein [Intrasporangium oryzae NRRL B-24470]
MSHLSIASTEADARAAAAVEQHHAAMAGALAVRVSAVLQSAARGERAAVDAAGALVTWSEDELVPHALAEESTLYAAARALPEGRLLIGGMVAEHAVILGLVREISDATEPVAAAAAARALQVVFEGHLAKENTLVLPLLTADPSTSVADLLGGLHELVGGTPSAHEGEHPEKQGHAEEGDHPCTCGADDPGALPELDARVIPHAIRHATIFGALDSLAPGRGLVVVAPHDPARLLAQVEAREPGVFSMERLEQGPETWRVALVRRAG